MDYLVKKEEISSLRDRMKYLAIYSGLISVVVVFLLIILLKKERQTVIVPPVIKEEFWVTDTQLSESYLTQISEFYLSLALNKTPKTAKHQTENLLKYTDPSLFEALKQKLMAADEQMIKDNITTSFFSVKDKVWQEAKRVEISGDFVSKVGDKSLPVKRLTYELQYQYQNGHLHIAKFNQIQQKR